MRFKHAPKAEYQDTIKIATHYINSYEEEDYREPITIDFVKVQSDKRNILNNGENTPTSGNTVFIDSKWSRGYRDIKTDFTKGSKVIYEGAYYVIEHVEYLKIQGHLHHVEVFLV